MIELLDAFDVNWSGATVLVIAPDYDSGPAGRACTERGAVNADVLNLAVPLAEPLAELSERGHYEIVVIGDLLYRLTPTEVHDVLRWIAEHLRPGGECLLETRTYLAPDGGGLTPQIRTPYAHLAFARDVIEEYCAERSLPLPSLTNPMCRATYLLLFRRVGLEVDGIQTEEHDPNAFVDKLRFYDAVELRVGRFRVRLRRPLETKPGVSELRAALKINERSA